MEGSDLTLEKSLTIAQTLESSEREAQEMEQRAAGPAGSAVGGTPVHAVHQQPARRQQGGTTGAMVQPRPPQQWHPPQQQRWQPPQRPPPDLTVAAATVRCAVLGLWQGGPPQG